MTTALRVLSALFDIDTASARTKLKGLDGALSQTKAVLGQVATSALGAFSVKAFGEFIHSQIELGSRVNDTAEKLGVSTDALQQFQYAAGQTGVDTEAAGTALGFLNKNLGEAIGGAAEQSKIFADLGVDMKAVKAGSVSATDVLPQLAKKFEETGSDAERTALAMKVFGKSGAALVPLLKQGSGELEKMFQKFDQLGGGMDQGFIKLADEAGDEIDNLKLAFNGLKSKVAVEVLPMVIDFAKKLQHLTTYAIQFAKETTVVRTALVSLGVVGAAAGAKAALGWAKFFGLFPKGNAGILKTLASLGGVGLVIGGVAAAALAVDDLAVAFDGGDSAIKAFLTQAGGVEYANKYIDDMKQAWDASKGSITQLEDPLKDVGKMLAEIGRDHAPEIIYAFDYIARVIGTAVASLATFIALLLQAKAVIVDGKTSGVDKILKNYSDTVFGKEGADGKSYGGFWGDTPPKKAGAAGGKFEGPSYLDPSSKDYAGYQPYVPGASVPAPGGTVVQGPTTIAPTYQTTINVQGGMTNEETGRRVGRSMREFGNENAASLAALHTGAPER